MLMLHLKGDLFKVHRPFLYTCYYGNGRPVLGVGMGRRWVGMEVGVRCDLYGGGREVEER